MLSPFLRYKIFFGVNGEPLRDGGDLETGFVVMEVLPFCVAANMDLLVDLFPLICPLSEGEESKEVDKVIPPSSGTSVSEVDTPAVAPAAFFAPSIAIGSADLCIRNGRLYIK